MKILLVARWPVGGIKTYLKYIYSASIFSDVQLTLLAPDNDLEEFINTQLPQGRMKLIPTASDRKSFIAAIDKCVGAHEFDLIHSHGFSASFYTQQAVWYRNIPHLLTAHDVFLPNTFKGVKGVFKKIAMYWLLAGVTRVLSVSDDARSNILEYFPLLRKKQIVNITNGIDTAQFAAGGIRDFKKELGLKNQPVIGFFGRFMAQKGFRQLVLAIEHIVKNNLLSCPPVVLTFGWGGFIREDYAYIEERQLSPYFSQLPGTNEMPAAINGVDLVVMPSRWEACPLLPMEVLSCGVPIIGTNCVGLREVLANTPAKIVDVGDFRQLAEAIVVQLAEGDEAFKNYQADAVKRFSADNHSQQLFSLYSNLLGQDKHA
jgi:glycosyltransferase involved in cell wall biosynthesis